MPKAIKVTRDGANCECCGVYDNWVIDLDCGHQIAFGDDIEVGEEVLCEECEE